ncbi:MAG: cobalamin biosynthesis protein CobW [Rhodospirillaceae bacterium]|nr:cobalamin biosynthesis protein CobW [Rhodospirillaceae bacterium]
MKKIPATIITGFLGAGKTTLLQHMLQHNRQRRLALIINEFGKTGIDGELLQSCGSDLCREEDIVELANGCLCCTVADDFIPTIDTLLNRSSLLDHIIIETSGLALPKPLVAAFNWPEVKARLTVDGVITVVDGLAALDPQLPGLQPLLKSSASPPAQHENAVHELFRDQLACADMIVLNKTDLLTGLQIQQVTNLLQKHKRPSAKIINSRFGQIPTEILLGIGAEAEENLDSRLSHHDQHPEEDHGHAEFTSFSIPLPVIQEVSSYIKTFEQLLNNPGVLRIKGFAKVAHKPMRLVIQGVGARVNYHYDRPWKKQEKEQGVLVVIGDHRLDEQRTRQQVLFPSIRTSS